ncbi:MAG: TraB/GumN family protein [Steroidobacteraceae bacterium]
MTPRRLACRLIAAGWLLFGASLGARADAAHHILWEVKGKHNTIYLLGSVHMLKVADSALPAAALHAYAMSKFLVMELDLNGVGAESLLESGAELETLPEGQSLADAAGPQLYAKLLVRAQPLGLEPEILSHFQPWFAALMLQQFELAKSGFDPAAGVDEQFAVLAQADHKPIIGLETIDEQLGFFAHLSLEQQREFLRSTLQDSATAESEADAVVQAWQRGDTVKLEQLLREETNESPELYRLLTTERNRRWLPKITQLLNGDDNYLVIVGALHLIGHDGVIELLQRQGYTAVQD